VAADAVDDHSRVPCAGEAAEVAYSSVLPAGDMGGMGIGSGISAEGTGRKIVKGPHYESLS